MRQENKQNAGQSRHDWKGLISSNIVTLICAYFVFISTQSTNQTEASKAQSQALSAAYIQIDSQGKQIVELRGLLLQQQLQIVELTSQLKDNVDANDLILKVFDSLPFPAWIKRFNDEKGEFVMFMINQAYTAETGITANEYIGKTDYDIHSKEIADRYKDSDLQVLLSGRPDKRRQKLVKQNGDQVDLIVYKFSIVLNNEKIGIAGVSLDMLFLE